MPQVQLNDDVFKVAQRRAADGGYATVDEYIADVVIHDLADEDEETPNLDHLFTPQVIAELEQISARAQAGGKTYTPEEVREHFRKKSEGWEEHQDDHRLHP